MAEGLIQLQWRPFAFDLPSPLRTAAGCLRAKRGWLLRLETPDGAVGWGEAAPLAIAPSGASVVAALAASIQALGEALERPALERKLSTLPSPLAFALGAALAEIDALVGPAAGGWLPPPPSAWLLPAGAAAIPALEDLLPGAACLTVKWKVAAEADNKELYLLEALLDRLPRQSRLRLDANGGWDRGTASAWAARLRGERRLEWLEQPLPPADQEGLEQLAEGLPVALDESLRQRPALRSSWGGWQVRRPSQEGDPRPLLAELQAGMGRRVLSTGFETGIGRRWLHHLAALQARGATPAAPGLAPGWLPRGGLFSADPQRVWAAAA